MAAKIRVALKSWANSVADLVQFSLSKGRNSRFVRTARILAGMLCVGFAGYLIGVSSAFLHNSVLPQVSVPAENTAIVQNDTALMPQVPKTDILEYRAVEELPKLTERVSPPAPSESEPEKEVPKPVDPAAMGWPVAGEISVDYGWYRHATLKDWRFSPGVVIEAPMGVPVRAALAGRVTYVGYNPERGLVVSLDHGSGWTTQYGYLSEAEVKPGNTVSKGQIIGRSGVSAEGQKALFFGVTYEGEDIDPTAFLR